MAKEVRGLEKPVQGTELSGDEQEAIEVRSHRSKSLERIVLESELSGDTAAGGC